MRASLRVSLRKRLQSCRCYPAQSPSFIFRRIFRSLWLVKWCALVVDDIGYETQRALGAVLDMQSRPENEKILRIFAIVKKQRTPLDAQMLLNRFEPPIIIITYSGAKPVEAVQAVNKFNFEVEVDSAPATLKKNDCLVAMSASSAVVVRERIKVRKSVREQNLGAAHGLAKRWRGFRFNKNKQVKVCLRNGLVLTGNLITTDGWHWLMRVGGEAVLLWKHGVEDIRGI